MDDGIIIGLAAIVVLGVGAQWIGRRLRIPSLLLLLPAGLLAGPVTGIVDPEQLFGESLFDAVSLGVALLLFHSGLRLRLDQLPVQGRRPILQLISIGMLVTFAGGAVTIALLLDVSTRDAALLGAILVVSGPTVVGPMLGVMRLREPTRSVIEWESTILDPLGATLGIVVLNAVLAPSVTDTHAAVFTAASIGLGAIVGIVAAAILVFVLGRFLVADDMEPAVALLFAVAAYTTASLIIPESGLMAATVLGLAVANQRIVPTQRIVGFGENLEVLIIGGLFIVLGAGVDLDALLDVALPTAAVVVVLVLAVRPLSAVLATTHTGLRWHDRALVAAVAPRGVVAAATSAQFALQLDQANAGADLIVPVTFGVIIGTGVIYGVGAPLFARRLGVSLPPATGLALVGNAPWLWQVGRLLHDHGANVRVVTRDESDDPLDLGVDPAALTATEFERILAEESMGEAIIATDDDGYSMLAMSIFIEALGHGKVHYLPPVDPQDSATVQMILERGRRTFGNHLTMDRVQGRLAAGADLLALSTPQWRDLVADDRAEATCIVAVTPAGGVRLAPGIDSLADDDVVVGLSDPIE